MASNLSKLRVAALAGISVLTIAAMTALLVSGIGLERIIGTPPESGATPVTVRIGEDVLTVAAEVLRFSDQRKSGSYNRIELELSWPGMLPLAPNDPVRNTTSRDGRLVFIAIEPRETEFDTADRIATVYQRFLASYQTSMPGSAPAAGEPEGLLRRDFLAGTSYEGDELYFEPGSVHPFAALCFPPDKGKPPLTCLREIRLGKHLIATIRFPISALATWRQLRDRADELLSDMLDGSSG